VEVKLEMPEQPALVEGSADLVKQVLINLIKNAVEAMPDGGQIVVRSKGMVAYGGRAMVQLQIADNGPGISAGVMNNLFLPVQSTKNGKNRGFGLSVVQDLVTKIGGLINCQSSNKGTMFELLLPVGKGVKPTALTAAIKDSA
jgi:signal transduction histidine kinase